MHAQLGSAWLARWDTWHTRAHNTACLPPCLSVCSFERMLRLISNLTVITPPSQRHNNNTTHNPLAPTILGVYSARRRKDGSASMGGESTRPRVAIKSLIQRNESPIPPALAPGTPRRGTRNGDWLFFAADQRVLSFGTFTGRKPELRKMHQIHANYTRLHSHTHTDWHKQTKAQTQAEGEEQIQPCMKVRT